MSAVKYLKSPTPLNNHVIRLLSRLKKNKINYLATTCCNVIQTKKVIETVSERRDLAYNVNDERNDESVSTRITTLSEEFQVFLRNPKKKKTEEV